MRGAGDARMAQTWVFPISGGEGNFPPRLMFHMRQNLRFQSLLRIRKI